MPDKTKATLQDEFNAELDRLRQASADRHLMRPDDFAQRALAAVRRAAGSVAARGELSDFSGKIKSGMERLNRTVGAFGPGSREAGAALEDFERLLEAFEGLAELLVGEADEDAGGSVPQAADTAPQMGM